MADKKILVKAKSPVKYGEKPFGIGEKLEVDAKTYEENKALFELVEEEEEPKEEEADGGSSNSKKQAPKKAAGDSR